MTPPRPGRGWLWYFVILIILAVASSVGLVVYNLRQQLTRDQLEAARAQWDAQGPRDYHLVYTMKGSVTATYDVQVRNGKVVSALGDGRPLESRLYPSYGMPGLFKNLEGFLDLKEQAGGSRRFLRAAFDPADGHVLQLVTSDPNTRNSVEVIVDKFEPLRPGKVTGD